MAENNKKLDETISLEERMPEIQDILDVIKGQPGAEISVKNTGSGPATEYAEITIRSLNGGGKTIEESYFAKRFIREKMLVPFPFLKSGGIKQSEFDLLYNYKELGCNVPTPIWKKGDVLVARKIDGVGLENKLSENELNEEARISLIKDATAYIDTKFHPDGRRIQGEFLSHNQDLRDRVMKFADLLQPAGDYFTSFVATGEELVSVKEGVKEGKELVEEVKKRCKENYSIFNSFFGVIKQHFSKQETQLIHGDMTTYHIMIDKDGKVWIIDLGKAKFSNNGFDLFPLYFSQDTNLPREAIEEMFREHLDKIHVPKDRTNEELKSLYLGGCFSNIGRGSKNRLLRIVFPREYLHFVSKHPSYVHSVSFYKSCTRELIEYVLNNREKFKVDSEDCGTMKSFLGLLKDFTLKENGCPAGILADYQESLHNIANQRTEPKPT